MLSIQEIERICNNRFNCKVQDWGFGTNVKGKREIHIIVGKKINPGFDPNSVYSNIKKNAKYIPDVRIKFIEPGAEEKDIILAIMNIKNSLPEDREIIIDSQIAGISQVEIKNEPIIEQNNVEKVISEDEHPADKQPEKDKNDMIMGALDDIANMLGDLTKRVGILEEKKPQGRPKKVVEEDIKKENITV